MPEIRRNPITGASVILAEGRGDRPRELDWTPVTNELPAGCPFCEGHEELTPDEIVARRSPDSQPNGPDWRVRVVANKFPALVGEAGLHEVIIESPRHLTSITELDEVQFAEVIDVYRQRLAELEADGRYRQALIFKNSGPAAGATLAHLHSQLVASSLNHPSGERSGALVQSPAPSPCHLPEGEASCVLSARAVSLRNLAKQTGRCAVCTMVEEELEQAKRIVDETDGFVAFCPYAARVPYEVWITPRAHASHFGQLSPHSLPEFAQLFRRLLVKLEGIVKLSAYNYIVHTAPFDIDSDNHYHWHIEILPRTTTLAGFELGTGCFINPLPPERAAAALRAG